MASGCNLTEGIFKDRDISNDEMWAIFNHVFSNQTKNTASYKFGFFKSLLDSLYNVDAELSLSFDTIFSKFTEIYWNIVLKHKLRQIDGRGISAIESILETAAKEWCGDTHIIFEKLPATAQLSIVKRVKAKCRRYVVGAFFVDTSSLLYSFSLKTETLKFNPQLYSFICRHKVTLEKLNYYEWAKFLERVNDNAETSLLLLKIDESTKRNNLDYYRQILFKEFEDHTCFYCGRKLNNSGIHVDHFIPWSFIKDDNLWNFVLSCPKCNTSKNDRLASQHYLETLIERNSRISIPMCSIEMKNYSEAKLASIYHWAIDNGYNRIWNPTI